MHHGSMGDTSPLLDSYHHRLLIVLRLDEPLEESCLLFMARSYQLLLQCWQ